MADYIITTENLNAILESIKKFPLENTLAVVDLVRSLKPLKKPNNLKPKISVKNNKPIEEQNKEVGKEE